MLFGSMYGTETRRLFVSGIVNRCSSPNRCMRFELIQSLPNRIGVIKFVATCVTMVVLTLKILTSSSIWPMISRGVEFAV